MQIEFRATTGAFVANENALVCGVKGEGQYLTFQRDLVDSDDDWGVYLEYGDQANGAYERIAKCRLSREHLQVDLSAELGSLSGVDRFDVMLAIDDASFAAVRMGLRKVFRGKPGILEME